MANKPISIIIPTYNGAQKIFNLLGSLEAQTFKNFEVVVVVDGSTDNTIEKIENKNFPFEVKLIIQENKGRAVTRNAGVKGSQGDLLVFFDDDVVPQEDCVQKHYDHSLQIKDSILVGITPEDKQKLKTDIQKYKLHLSLLWYKNISETSVQLSSSNFFLAAANLSMSRHIFNRLNGFDERLKDAEDQELGIRALQNKISIYFTYEAVAFHNDLITCRSYIIRQREYMEAKKQLSLLDNEKKPVVRKNGAIVNFIYNFFSRKIWVDLIDNFNVFIIFPKSLRFKLYSLIIWGLATKYPERKI